MQSHSLKAMRAATHVSDFDTFRPARRSAWCKVTPVILHGKSTPAILHGKVTPVILHGKVTPVILHDKSTPVKR